MQQNEQLEYGQYYHLYNHAVGGLDLFKKHENYDYFLNLYDKHIYPIAETYAWVLMKNHFHFLVRIRSVDEVVLNLNLNLTGFENLSGLKPLHQHFSNLFNAYTKAYNKYFETRGALFERPFRRKRIDNERYLKQLILYIHNNPVHHGFCKHPLEYPWSSYLTFINNNPTKLMRDEVVELFENKENYLNAHQMKVERIEIEKWLEL